MERNVHDAHDDELDKEIRSEDSNAQPRLEHSNMEGVELPSTTTEIHNHDNVSTPLLSQKEETQVPDSDLAAYGSDTTTDMTATDDQPIPTTKRMMTSKQQYLLSKGQHIKDSLSMYEHELERLKQNLGIIRSSYLAAVLNQSATSDAEEYHTTKEEDEQLVHAMASMEVASRSKGLAITPTKLPKSREAQKARALHWKRTLETRDIERQLAPLEEEIQQLTMIDNVLRMEEKLTSGIKPDLKQMEQITNPRCDPNAFDTNVAELSPTTDNDLRVWIDDALDAEPLFSVELLHTTSQTDTAYRATAMQLTIDYADSDSPKSDISVKAIVDSGAAWSAIDKATLQRQLPNCNINSSDRKFKDASNNLMKVVGRVELCFWVGDLRLLTTAYVFDNLGAEFLLGVNSLVKHDLSISTQRKVLFSEAPHATSASQETVQFAGLVQQAECPECTADINGQRVCDGAGCNGFLIQCHAQECTLTVNTPTAQCTVTYEGQADQDLTAIMMTENAVTDAPIESTRRGRYESLLRTKRTYTITAEKGLQELRLIFDELCPGAVTDLDVSIVDSFEHAYGTQLSYLGDQLHSTINAAVPWLVKLRPGAAQCTIPAGTPVAKATHRTRQQQGVSASINLANLTELNFRTIEDPPANALKWRPLNLAPDTPATINGEALVSDRKLDAPSLATKLGSTLILTPEEWATVRPRNMSTGRLRMSHYVQAQDGIIYAPAEELAFELGGRPRNRADLHQLGFSLDKAINPCGAKDCEGKYPPLPETQKQRLYDLALKWYCVWSRDAKTPELSRLVIIDIPVGDAKPVAQKPYPLPYKYLEAVRKEVQTLLDGGLIEPVVSNWASPILVRLKKDSTPDDIRLKIICDFRRLNEVTIPDAAGLGNQDEILHGFGGNQRFAGIVDAAGGFYQFLINPEHKHRTAFVLPTSMGGTSFAWRVAPYGLTRNPAGYSRGMMLALKGLSSCSLPGGTGGAASWIDDVSLHADSFDAFAELFELILTRIAFAGMSLKAEKCYLLHQQLEVLGYYITPDGLVMQGDKLEGLRKLYDREGKPFGPANVKEVRQFLGAVQFYRRFVPRLALLAAPMNLLLKKLPDKDPRQKKGTPEHIEMMAGVQQSYEAIMMFLQSSAVISAPDFQDPLAEFVICPDACDIAAGGVLLQWQWPVHGEFGPGPPAGTPLRGSKGSDPISQSWREPLGWKLRTIEYYSKTFDVAQQNYPTFDKEAAAILLCCRKWAQLITCHPTTVYTDSAVAASMLTKYPGPPRLQRWGMELGTFLPFLKIQHRAGILNGMADFLSRFPTFEKYVAPPDSTVELPLYDFADVAEVPLFSHELVSADDQRLLNWRYLLKETTDPTQATAIWQGDAVPMQTLQSTVMLNTSPSVSPNYQASHHEAARMIQQKYRHHRAIQDQRQDALVAMAKEIPRALENTVFWEEQQAFDQELEDWALYVEIFSQTHGRAPILYDFFCGEGGFSRGARAAGCDCYGFDNATACKLRYENEPNPCGETAPSFMTFVTADLESQSFWDTLLAKIQSGVLPMPDLIHASPPCAPFTRMTCMNNGQSSATTTELTSIDRLLRRLRTFETQVLGETARPLLWQVENAVESTKHVYEPVAAQTVLCGTMMGHRVFRHRVFYCNYALSAPQRHDHAGKYVSSRGVRGNAEFNRRFHHLPEPNMYGIYSRPYAARGNTNEWHGALGASPYTYSTRGLAGCLPSGYGRLTAYQMIAHSLNREFQCPVWPAHEMCPLHSALLRQWSKQGYHPVKGSNHRSVLDYAEMEASVIAPVLETTKGDVPIDWSNFTLPDETFTNQFVIKRSAQLADPELSPLIRRLEDPKTINKAMYHTLRTQFQMRSGLLYRMDHSHGEFKGLLVVPEEQRPALMKYFHYANHRGHEPLISQLQQSYWWPRLAQDCVDFTATCSVCGPLQSGQRQRTPEQPIPTPSQPFSVIHVDHKGPLPRPPGTKFTNILVVVCALTRFALFIPVEGTTAEETLKALVSRVFCVFGTPAVIVSDNGPAFRSKLSSAASNFFGYRHIHTLPYNPQANGVAEAAVKRIKLLLDRQTVDYANWHTLLALSQQMLNTTVHTGLGITPHEALFGREPIGLEKLENPALYPEGDGEELLTSAKQRMLRLHQQLVEASDAIKNARVQERNARENSRLANARRGTVLPSTATEDRYVWLRYGSEENAAYIRKHGHGAPWRHRYKVLETRPHAVRLQVPTDGSVPRVLEWQPMRRVSVARSDEHGPTGDEPYLTDSGIAVRKPSGKDAVGEEAADTEVYEIDRIVKADRIGNRYKIWIKWKGYQDITSRWRHELLNDPTTNEALKADIEDAVQLARDRHQLEHGYLDEENIYVDHASPPDMEIPEDVPSAQDSKSKDSPVDARTLRLQQRKARRNGPDAIEPSLITLVHPYLRDLAWLRLTAASQVSDDYTPLSAIHLNRQH